VSRVDPDDGAAHRVEGDLVVAHDDELQVERLRRQHAPLAGDDAVDADELRLDDVLEVGDLLVQAVVVVDEAVPVVLDPDVVLHREGHRRPRVRLELGAVDEEVGLRDGLGREDVVAQALLVRVGDLDLRLLLEAVALHALARGGASRPSRSGVREARGDGDAAALAHRELGHLVAADVPQRAEHALAELGARVRVRELVARGDQVRFDERASLRGEAELRSPSRTMVRMRSGSYESHWRMMTRGGAALGFTGSRLARRRALSTVAVGTRRAVSEAVRSCRDGAPRDWRPARPSRRRVASRGPAPRAARSARPSARRTSATAGATS
jgi:hypothetical protein